MGTTKTLKVSAIIATVFISCCYNVYVLELITRESPKAGNIITFAQFLFIALEGLIFEVNFFTKRRMIPLTAYIYLVISFFLVSVCNNYALAFSISMPLHMIVKSGSLITNMILGIIILKKRYKRSKYLAVALITVGIVMCTIASSPDVKEPLTGTQSSTSGSFGQWLFGLSLLLASLVFSSRMGIYQEEMATNYGKHPKESMFYCHALPLPAFILLYSDITNQAEVFSASSPVEVPLAGSGFYIPHLWWYLILNATTQFVVSRSVFTLTTECSSLVVTLVVTLRKFLSLVISIYSFDNPFTRSHWVGTVAIFFGTCFFVELLPTKWIDSNVRKTSLIQAATSSSPPPPSSPVPMDPNGDIIKKNE